jgi:hypothetical protein
MHTHISLTAEEVVLYRGTSICWRWHHSWHGLLHMYMTANVSQSKCLITAKQDTWHVTGLTSTATNSSAATGATCRCQVEAYVDVSTS